MVGESLILWGTAVACVALLGFIWLRFWHFPPPPPYCKFCEDTEVLDGGPCPYCSSPLPPSPYGIDYVHPPTGHPRCSRCPAFPYEGRLINEESCRYPSCQADEIEYLLKRARDK